MTSIQTKQQSKPSKHSGLIPIDMSWGQMDKMFDSLRNHWPFHFTDEAPFKLNGQLLSPDVDVSEDKKSYKISADLPGLDSKDISLDISDNVLTISGERKTESERDDENNYHIMERSHGYFKRSFSLPVAVEQDKIKADFKNGVLHVTLPKSEKAQQSQRKIPISS
ncbi:Hsp20/alpha crystallin family protein [Aliiglaciecola sp. LCG003]|uniref:Hsp20/alpha crystallin family protein n=1 Tax=Aliiglaciecola sp. LCG003 TaxID=3053655 RepID=UPI0025735CA2|nr:Hsp20/alpha crystallin family protein [Aliiglaciecola sp. LCG003]WJG08606.1 Hsp20/alpha crystallin family protein [Aliiglaciecola sp. LCG003]